MSKEDFDKERARLEMYNDKAPKKGENYLPTLIFNKQLCENVCN